MATTVRHDKIPPKFALRKTASGRPLSTRNVISDWLDARAADQTVPSLTLIHPSVVGIAEQKRQAAAAVGSRMAKAVAALSIVQDAALNADDPGLQMFAERLMANPKFLAILNEEIEAASAEIAKMKAERGEQEQEPTNPAAAYAAEADAPDEPAAKPTGGWAVSDPTAPGADPDEVESAETVARSGGGSKLPGTDSARLAAKPGSYSAADLTRDLGMMEGAVAMLTKQRGFDAAYDAVYYQHPLIPAWDSNLWSADARDAFRRRADLGNGFAVVHMRGNVPAVDGYLADSGPAPEQGNDNGGAASRTGGAPSVVTPAQVNVMRGAARPD